MTDRADSNVVPLTQRRAPRPTTRRSFDHPSYGPRRSPAAVLAETPVDRSA